MRGGIRHLDLAVDAKLVERAGTRAGDRDLVPSARMRLHGMGTVEHELDTLGRRRPQAERHAIRMQPRPMRMLGIHAAPENARTERAGACDLAPEANRLARLRRRGGVEHHASSGCTRGSIGSLNSIVSGAALRTT